MNQHLQGLIKWVQDKNLDIAYISNPTNISYFSGFFQDPEERVTGLFVFPDKDPFLFTPALSIQEVKRSGWPYDVYGYLDHEDPFALIASHIRERIADHCVGALKRTTCPFTASKPPCRTSRTPPSLKMRAGSSRSRS